MPHLRRVDIEGPFRNAMSQEFEKTSYLLGPSCNSFKGKFRQVAGSLHVDCATAGVDLYLHDRTFALGSE